MDFKPFKIGKYLLLEKLATGGMAEVYRAKASGAGGFEKQLAIKRILPNYSSNEEFRRMFEYEARLSSMLTHANIVQIYDFVKSGDTYLLAMEYVDGKNLRQFVNKARKLAISPPIEFGVSVINEVCKGLEYAHKKKDDLTGKSLNIIHRDMSPQNIMLSYDGACKIVDFGIAKAKDRVDETRSGVIKGKFGYMSPEQANGEPVDHRTDIFSTGIILYELLTGKRLFAADNDMATLKQIQECVVPSPSRLNPKVTQELEKILMKALTKDLGLRYQSAGQFHRSLQEYLNKFHPSYTQREVSDVLQRTFAEEIAAEKRRFEQIYRQSIPFSQGAQQSFTGSEDNRQPSSSDDSELDDEPITASEGPGERTAVTYAGEESELSGGWQDESGMSVSRDEGEEDAGSVSRESTHFEPLIDDEEGALGGENTGDSIPTQAGKERSATGSRTGTGKRSGGGPRREPTKAPPEDETEGGDRDYPTGERTLVKGRKTDPDEDDPSGPLPEVQTGSWDEGSIRRRSPPAPKLKEDTRTPNSGISLSSPSDGTSVGRRRDRSISAVSEVSGGQGQGRNLTLEPLNENASIHVDPRGGQRGRAAPQPFRVEEPEPEFDARRRARPALSLLALLLIVAGGAYLYQSTPHPVATDPAPGTGVRDPADEPTPAVAKSDGNPSIPPVNPNGKSDCGIEVTSDPPGARVIVDGADRGATPTTVIGGCGQAIDIVIKADGYGSDRANVVLKNRSGRYVRALKKIPTGTLELVLNYNAQLYLEGRLIGEAAANKVFEKELDAGKRYRIRFVNELQGIDEEHDFAISENLRSGGRLKLGSGRPR